MKILISITAIVATGISLLFIYAATKGPTVLVSSVNFLLAALILVSNMFWIKSINRLTNEGQNQFWNIVIWSKLLAGKENFTSSGWQYWVMLRFTTVLFVVLFVVRLFLVSE